mgnify:CR=1 FL=1
MKKLPGNRTSFIIAPRLSTIRDADRIVVMENGALIETGTHASLLQAHGLYARMFLAGQARQALPPAATSPCGGPTGPRCLPVSTRDRGRSLPLDRRGRLAADIINYARNIA